IPVLLLGGRGARLPTFVGNAFGLFRNHVVRAIRRAGKQPGPIETCRVLTKNCSRFREIRPSFIVAALLFACPRKSPKGPRTGRTGLRFRNLATFPPEMGYENPRSGDCPGGGFVPMTQSGCGKDSSRFQISAAAGTTKGRRYSRDISLFAWALSAN